MGSIQVPLQCNDQCEMQEKGYVMMVLDPRLAEAVESSVWI
jgi:hypothetical protein